MTTTMAGRPRQVPAEQHPIRERRRMKSVARNLWWFVVPAFAMYMLVVIVPTLQGIGWSLTDWNAFSRERPFVGLDNYREVLAGASGAAIYRTLFIAAATMLLQNVIGLLLAVALHGRVYGRNVLRTLIFAPVVVSPVVVGYLFQYLFGPPNTGAINTVLAALGLEQQQFLGEPNSALTIVIVAIVWQSTGISMVIYLAGLQGVPPELLEAAAIDGAGAFRRFLHVTAPLLAPSFTINLMLTLIGGLKVFDMIFIVTSGGPGGATETISTLIYKNFSMLGEYGASAALAVLLAIAVAALSMIQFAVLRRREGNTR